MVSYVGNKTVPFLRIYRYKEAFAFDFVMDFLRRFEADSDDYVFDPFSGLGTAMFTSMISFLFWKNAASHQKMGNSSEEVVEILGRKKLNNPKIPSMITTYFIGMQKVITEWFKVLAPCAKIAMVVDNVRFEGELIPVDLILSEMAEKAGFKVKEIIVARYKGNSSQQMRKYGRVPVRESIVIWVR